MKYVHRRYLLLATTAVAVVAVINLANARTPSSLPSHHGADLVSASMTQGVSTAAQSDATVIEAPVYTRGNLLLPSDEPATPKQAAPLGCQQTTPPTCFTPVQVQGAYNVRGLHASGITGAGVTVVVSVSFGSPTLTEDVASFSHAMGLPDADVSQVYPLGNDFSQADRREMGGWAGETTLDVEWIHAMAPAAKIVVVVSPVAETEGIVGLPEMLAVEKYALDHHLGTIISQSWGTSEDLLDDDAGREIMRQFDDFYQQANAAGVTIVTSSGDHGALADTMDEGVGDTRSADWPAASPWSTTVGGTILSLNPDGSYASERVLDAENVASGSGISRFYPQPSTQNALSPDIQQKLAGYRGEADVSAIGLGLIIHITSGSSGGPKPGSTGGTSASAPIWAGIIALANQSAGRGLGNINPALYALGAAGRCFHDITIGTNAFHGDPGEPALAGWDFPTGWGTPDAGCLVPALAASARGS